GPGAPAEPLRFVASPFAESLRSISTRPAGIISWKAVARRGSCLAPRAGGAMCNLAAPAFAPPHGPRSTTRHPEFCMFSENIEYVDEQFRRWQQDPNSVDATWQAFFAGMQFAGRLPGAGEPASGVSADARVQTGATRLVFW